MCPFRVCSYWLPIMFWVLPSRINFLRHNKVLVDPFPCKLISIFTPVCTKVFRHPVIVTVFSLWHSQIILDLMTGELSAWKAVWLSHTMAMFSPLYSLSTSARAHMLMAWTFVWNMQRNLSIASEYFLVPGSNILVFVPSLDLTHPCTSIWSLEKWDWCSLYSILTWC